MGTLNNLSLKNQYGEVSINEILPSQNVPLPAQAAHTIVANNTAGSAAPTAVAVQAIANALDRKSVV